MPTTHTTDKPGLHPRNRAAGGYDFAGLTALFPPLGRHVTKTADGQPTIDFAHPEAVRALNRALLLEHYGIANWRIPAGYLCPPIPGRADYIHQLADLLADCNGGELPPGERIRGLDIGTGANGVYPLIGCGEYGWRFVGVDIDQAALDNVATILQDNPPYKSAIELRLQPVSGHVFTGILRKGEYFDFSLCNPPFHDSPASVEEASRRKWRQLGRKEQGAKLNFGGRNNELWCPGGERAFLQTMIEESTGIPRRCLWFTSLLSQEGNLKPVEAMLKKARVAAHRIIDMAQGQKRSRIVAWTFHTPAEMSEWQCRRWLGMTPGVKSKPRRPAKHL